MIYMDHPKKVPFRGQMRWHAHLWSNLPGWEGYAELMGFATARMPLRARWLQYKGKPKEHFDMLSRKNCDLAQQLGAIVVPTRVWVRHVRAKEANL